MGQGVSMCILLCVLSGNMCISKSVSDGVHRREVVVVFVNLEYEIFAMC